MNDAFLAELRGEYSRRRKYLVGVSGGRDSVALLDCLGEAGFQKLVVCHLNHGLRGRDAAADAAFVQELAEQRGLASVMRKVNVEELASREGWSLETAARVARRAFYAEAAREQRCERIFLGHHADDQAETVLMHLARGSGLEGLAGMGRESQQRVSGVELTLLRPLLGVRRATIDEWISHRGLQFCEDASNADLQTGVRNRVRHRLLPHMNEIFGRDVALSLTRLAEIAADDQALIEEAYALPLQQAETEEQSVAELGEMPVALRRRVLRHWLRARGIGDCGFSEVRKVDTLLTPPLGSGPAKINLPGGWHARRREGKLFLERPEAPAGGSAEAGR